MGDKTLFERLGGYEGIVCFVKDLLPRLQADEQLGRFWAHRGDDGVAREQQLLVDFLCHCSGGPMYYTGRDMKTSHKGMRISDGDWAIFLAHAGDAMQALDVPQQERDDIVSFVMSLKDEIVED